MRRDLGLITSKVFDVLVIGGGIHGACVAWDAALRGLSVAMIDKGDFGHATSANSLKIIHGGLRYLQDPDLRLARTMITERMAFMRIAPHLVHPVPCVMPIYEGVLVSKPVMTIALAINDALGFDRNSLSDPDRHLPRGRVVSRVECLDMLPGVRKDGLAGAAVWYDCQVYSPERLTLSFVLSADECGATVANYVEATAFIVDGNSVTGVKARDVLSGATFEVRGRVVINTAGPWTDCLLRTLPGRSSEHPLRLSRAMNLVTRQVIPGQVVALPARTHGHDGRSTAGERSRLLLMASWRSYSLLGTLHLPFEGNLPEWRVEENEIEHLIAQINLAYPAAGITRGDVFSVHAGLLPVVKAPRSGNTILLRKPRIVDHGTQDGIEGLLTVVGVKYSLARKAAQAATDLALRKLGREYRGCRTAEVPLFGGRIERFSSFVEGEIGRSGRELAAGTVRRLASTYGNACAAIADSISQDQSLGEKVSEGAEVTRAEIVHAIREEMAVKLADAVFRRTELGAAKYPGDACLRASAEIMGAELGWTQTQVDQELQEVRSRFPLAA